MYISDRVYYKRFLLNRLYRSVRLHVLNESAGQSVKPITTRVKLEQSAFPTAEYVEPLSYDC